MKKVLVYMLKLIEIESKGDERRWMVDASSLSSVYECSEPPSPHRIRGNEIRVVRCSAIAMMRLWWYMC